MEGETTASSVPPAPTSATVHTSNRSELLHTVWSLAWPVIITYAFESLVGLVDTLMVGRLGAASVAAVGVGAQILSGVNVAMMAVGTGTLALVARHWGGREHREAALHQRSDGDDDIRWLLAANQRQILLAEQPREREEPLLRPLIVEEVAVAARALHPRSQEELPDV